MMSLQQMTCLDITQFMYIPESPEGVKFQPLNHQKNRPGPGA